MRRIAVLILLPLLAGDLPAAPDEPPRGAVEIERYPASFRLKVAQAIERGTQRLVAAQAPQGHWGDPVHEQAMGHTALPLLALLKAGMEPDADPIRRAFAVLRTLEFTRTYSVACYAMAIHARYAPQVGTLDTDVDASRHEVPKPKHIRRRLSEEDRDALEKARAWLLSAQATHGLWHYGVQDGPNPRNHDLSNTQYAVLGLRAVAACGLDVPHDVWKLTFTGLLRLQATDGPSVDLLEYRVKGAYAFKRTTDARARGFRYRMDMEHGPQGENTVPRYPETGSMTSAGIACLLICREALSRHARFRTKEKRKLRDSVNDGLAWLQQHFSVEENPGRESKSHHHYYLYGIERAGMLAGRRWIGVHDWYREGADFLLATEDAEKGWGKHVETSFVILFLKRATLGPKDAPAVTGR